MRLECGDAFGLEKSLAYHYGRRSVHIEVACTHCSKTLVFFNKCALLAHARDHKNKGMVMQCTQLFMKPIAVDQMLAPSKPVQSVNQIPCENNTTELSKIQVVLPLYHDRVIRNGFKCSDCNKQMSDSAALAGHYQRMSLESESLVSNVPSSVHFICIFLFAHTLMFCVCFLSANAGVQGLLNVATKQMQLQGPSTHSHS